MPVHAVLSPLPGIFYRSSAPGEPAFKNVGDRIQPDDVIGLVEVMKQFSEVTADVAGVVLEFKVDNEAPVEAGAVLVEIEVA